jgi:hypothetical protein
MDDQNLGGTRRGLIVSCTSRCVAWLGLLLVSGCSSKLEEQDAKVADKDELLTADIAKRTLLEMEPGQIGRSVMIPRPKDEPIEFRSADEIAIGIWNCNLKEKTFHAFAHYPKAKIHRINDVSGVFQRTPGGKWVAKVTHSRSAG